MSEKEQELELLNLLYNTGLFSVYTQCWGRCYHIDPHAICGKNTSGVMCIDIIIVPKEKAILEGWSYGPIGIEVKDINKKMGPGISQCIDYKNSIWQLDEVKFPNFWINLKYVFYYPMESPTGLLASIFAQNRIGTAEQTNYYKLKLSFSSFKIFCINNDNTYNINTSCSAGMKLGSR